MARTLDQLIKFGTSACKCPPPFSVCHLSRSLASHIMGIASYDRRQLAIDAPQTASNVPFASSNLLLLSSSTFPPCLSSFSISYRSLGPSPPPARQPSTSQRSPLFLVSPPALTLVGVSSASSASSMPSTLPTFSPQAAPEGSLSTHGLPSRHTPSMACTSFSRP